jgi:hypothetical protein
MFSLAHVIARPKSALAAVWLCLSVLAPAQEAETDPLPSDDRQQVVFEGRIGNKALVRAMINVTPDDNGGSTLLGTYHYVSKGRAIQLWGRLEGDQASLEESAYRYGDPVTGRFEGKWSLGDAPGRASFSGSWTSGDGQRKLPFTLKEVQDEGVSGLDFYFFAEEYARQQGSNVLRREQSLSLPQLRGQGKPIKQVNGFIRSLAMLQLAASKEPPQADDSPSTPSLKALENAVQAALPDHEELKTLEVGHFASLTFDEDFVVMLNTREVLSLRMLHSEYTGGAHPNHSAGHVTFDLKSGEELTLDDLLKPGWRDAVTRLAEASLREQHGLTEGDPLNGEGPLFENAFELNDNWFLTPEGLGFSFDPYEIGPYAAGFIEPIIPFAMLQDWVRPGSTLERVIGK